MNLHSLIPPDPFTEEQHAFIRGFSHTWPDRELCLRYLTAHNVFEHREAVVPRWSGFNSPAGIQFYIRTGNEFPDTPEMPVEIV
jgi:hypothetical protein